MPFLAKKKKHIIKIIKINKNEKRSTPNQKGRINISWNISLKEKKNIKIPAESDKYILWCVADYKNLLKNRPDKRYVMETIENWG